MSIESQLYFVLIIGTKKNFLFNPDIILSVTLTRH